MPNRQQRRAAKSIVRAKKPPIHIVMPPIPAVSGDEAVRCDKCKHSGDREAVNGVRALLRKMGHNAPELAEDAVVCFFFPGGGAEMKVWGYCSGHFAPKEEAEF